MYGHLFHLETVQLVLDLLSKGRRQAVTGSRLAPAVIFGRMKGMVDGTLGRPVQPLSWHRAGDRSWGTTTLARQAQHRSRRVEGNVRVETGSFGTLRLVGSRFERIEAGRKRVHDLVRSRSINMSLIGNVSKGTRFGRLTCNISRVGSCTIPRGVRCRKIRNTVIRRNAYRKRGQFAPGTKLLPPKLTL